MVLDMIKNRRSTRAYKKEQVSDREIMALLEAGAWAPSGHNMQPWHFTVVQRKELIDNLSDISKDTFKNSKDEIARKMANNPDFNLFYNSPTVIIVSYKNDAVTPIEDISAAIQNILIQGEEMDLGTCWNGFIMGAFKGDQSQNLIKELSIPSGYTPHQAISVGYPKAKVQNAPIRKNDYYNFIK